jgi:hypothetical protein
MLTLHAEAMTFLRDELAKDWDGETIVATHTSPSVLSLMPGSHTHDWLYACTDIGGDLFERVDCWAHGHIHQSRDYEIDGCHVVANPRGCANALLERLLVMPAKTAAGRRSRLSSAGSKIGGDRPSDYRAICSLLREVAG